MDFSKFSDPKFDVKEWVNGALRTHKDTQTPVDVSEESVWDGQSRFLSLHFCREYVLINFVGGKFYLASEVIYNLFMTHVYTCRHMLPLL